MSETTSIVSAAARRLQFSEARVRAVADLLESGATVPFIARYRKEATGSLDEVAIAEIRDEIARVGDLEKRRAAVLASLEERGLLSDELARDVLRAETLAELEDRYLPYRPKRRTRASMARDRGLAPLAEALMDAARRGDGAFEPHRVAADYVDPSREVGDAEEALAGARDVIAEAASEDPGVRADLRRLYSERGLLRTRVVAKRREEASTYRDYFDRQEPVERVPSHRILAALRGEAEGMLRVSVEVPQSQALKPLERRFLRGGGEAVTQVRLALEDGLKRLLGPAMATETLRDLKTRADEEAIRVFSSNLRELLLAAPLGGRGVLAIDPGFRTGCKTAVVDPTGRLLHHETIQPHASKGERRRAAERVRALVEAHTVEAIAVGNGTAGRETEVFLREALAEGVGTGSARPRPSAPPVVMVNESGASVYSASQVARDELPDVDVTVRGAVSIGRRLQDPMSELVKIDPRSIGVGQYQHDVDQGRLKAALDETVEWAVNEVGVDVNSAGAALLSYVSGFGPTLARNVVGHRDEHGRFDSLRDLLEVPRLGPKAFEQAAGFLRLRGGREPLDASAVHPERYGLVARMAADQGVGVPRLLEYRELRARIDPARYVDASAGLPTITDILEELEKPGRDPRPAFEAFSFADGVSEMEDLEAGMRLPGIVTNVTNFGAFVDVGVHQDGLVHVSRLADRYVADPTEIVHVGQRVLVRVLEVDLERRRIGLSLRD